MDNKYFTPSIEDIKQNNMNNVLIGRNAGTDLTTEENVVIIGHDITSLDRSQENCVFIGKNVAMSREVWDAIGKVLGIELKIEDGK